ncbi:MAG: M15 family metallopeptidase [Acidimicrobiia bacterium]|nr:M15 family metallopeptidase [Acidimicrobiia bacterium]
MVGVLAACAGGGDSVVAEDAGTTTTIGGAGANTTSSLPSPPAPTVTTTPVPAATTTTTISPFARPVWLGTRPLPLRPDEHGEVQPTPPVLVDRRLATPPDLPSPAGTAFEWSIEPVPTEVLARSSWVPDCPVTVDELAYVTVSHMGFDGEYHTGELLINAAWAEEVVQVFETLHAAAFPIEQMRIIRAEEIDAPPTGDWNDTTSFVCRPAVGNTSWSQHAYGLAVDVNPFHNPYLKGDLVLPELASAYTDRANVRPGMIEAGDVVVTAFGEMGWAWGGNWNTLKDWMHFSASGG